MKKFYGSLMALLAASSFTAGIVVNESLSEDFQPEKNTAKPAVGDCRRPSARLYRSSVQPEFLLSAFSRTSPDGAKKKLDLNQAEEIFGRALETTNFDQRLVLLDEVIFGLADEYVQEALEWSDRIPLSEDRRFFTLDLLSRWAKQEYALRLVNAWERNAIEVANRYYESELTEWAEPDFITEGRKHALPNDPLLQPHRIGKVLQAGPQDRFVR